jgi:hypothetical protein
MKKAVVANYATTAFNYFHGNDRSRNHHCWGSGFCLEAPQASQGQSKKKGVAAKPKHNKDFGYI